MRIAIAGAAVAAVVWFESSKSSDEGSDDHPDNPASKNPPPFLTFPPDFRLPDENSHTPPVVVSKPIPLKQAPPTTSTRQWVARMGLTSPTNQLFWYPAQLVDGKNVKCEAGPDGMPWACATWQDGQWHGMLSDPLGQCQKHPTAVGLGENVCSLEFMPAPSGAAAAGNGPGKPCPCKSGAWCLSGMCYESCLPWGKCGNGAAIPRTQTYYCDYDTCKTDPSQQLPSWSWQGGGGN